MTETETFSTAVSCQVAVGPPLKSLGSVLGSASLSPGVVQCSIMLTGEVVSLP